MIQSVLETNPPPPPTEANGVCVGESHLEIPPLPAL